jgi:hypothetical protein
MYFEPPAMRRARPPVAMVRVSGAEFGDHAFEDAVDQADVAVVEADLEVVDGVGADDLGGLADVDAGQAGGAGRRGRRRRCRGLGRWLRRGTRLCGLMASKVVAVPKSTTRTGGWEGRCRLQVAGCRLVFDEEVQASLKEFDARRRS